MRSLATAIVAILSIASLGNTADFSSAPDAEWSGAFRKTTSTHTGKTTKTVSAASKQEAVVPINIGIGPAFHQFWGPLGDEVGWLYGFSLDVYAVITPEVLQAKRDKIPKKWRKMVSFDKEMHIRPFYLMLLPRYVLLQPTGSVKAYGATWELFGLQWSLPTPKWLEAGVDLQLPTLSYLQVEADTLNSHTARMFGIGAGPAVGVTLRPSQSWALSARYAHELYLPIGTASYRFRDGKDENLIQHGIAAIEIHIRIPTKQKI